MPKPPPPAPTPVDPAVVRAMRREQERAAARRGLGSTVLTGKNTATTQAPVAKKTLLGE